MLFNVAALRASGSSLVPRTSVQSDGWVEMNVAVPVREQQRSLPPHPTSYLGAGSLVRLLGAAGRGDVWLSGGSGSSRGLGPRRRKDVAVVAAPWYPGSPLLLPRGTPVPGVPPLPSSPAR